MGGERPDVTIDTSRAHPARVYDYWLGGKDNFAADREAAQQALQAYPQLTQAVQSNRRFLGRAVRYLTAEAGIRQFLELVEPGVVPTSGWRPDSDLVATMPSGSWCAVARKP
jgi:S-adenosyl methyltransferase